MECLWSVQRAATAARLRLGQWCLSVAGLGSWVLRFCVGLANLSERKALCSGAGGGSRAGGCGAANQCSNFLRIRPSWWIEPEA